LEATTRRACVFSLKDASSMSASSGLMSSSGSSSSGERWIAGAAAGPAGRAAGAGFAAGLGAAGAPGRDVGDHRAHRHLAAVAVDDSRQHAVVEALQLHHGLVGFDLGQHIALVHGVALVRAPLDDLARLHAVG